VLAAVLKVVELIREGRAEVANMYPRVVTREGNRPAQQRLWSVFDAVGGRWRGIADIPGGNLRLREAWAAHDARRRFTIDVASQAASAPVGLAQQCICGEIMAGLKQPTDCTLFGRECVPESPVGACMVSSEGSCKIWHTYGGLPDLREVG